MPIVSYEKPGVEVHLQAGPYILHASGNTVPTDADTGYATGCLFAHLDGGDGTSLYVNEGTPASCDFNAITVA